MKQPYGCKVLTGVRKISRESSEYYTSRRPANEPDQQRLQLWSHHRYALLHIHRKLSFCEPCRKDNINRGYADEETMACADQPGQEPSSKGTGRSSVRLIGEWIISSV